MPTHPTWHKIEWRSINKYLTLVWFYDNNSPKTPPEPLPLPRVPKILNDINGSYLYNRPHHAMVIHMSLTFPRVYCFSTCIAWSPHVSVTHFTSVAWWLCNHVVVTMQPHRGDLIIDHLTLTFVEFLKMEIYFHSNLK